jgi:hypothetical protein
MANGIDVRIAIARLILCAFMAIAFAESSRAAPPTEHGGRVIDQETGKGISGAFVIGTYIAFGPHQSLCRRIEGTVSDSEGRFKLPIDPRIGIPLAAAYKPGYGRGNKTRKAGPTDERATKWVVEIVQWDEDNQHGRAVGREPGVYSTRAEAMQASGEADDVYLRKLRGAKKSRIEELNALSGDASCAGLPKSSDAAKPFLSALYKELLELDAPQSVLDPIRRELAIPDMRSGRHGR